MNDVKAWFDTVERYATDLSRLVDGIDGRLDNLRLTTIEAGPSKIEPTLIRLAQSLEELEMLVVRRDELIRDKAAPPQGLTLSDKLLSLRSVEGARLSRRLKEVAAAVETVNTRATSMFVCHYHLHELTNDLVRTVTGDRRSDTYGRSGKSVEPPRGGIFDDAA